MNQSINKSINQLKAGVGVRSLEGGLVSLKMICVEVSTGLRPLLLQTPDSSDGDFYLMKEMATWLLDDTRLT